MYENGLTGLRDRRSAGFEAGEMSSWMEKLQQAKAQLAKHDADPLREKVAAVVRGMEAISTAALLDLIGLPPTTGNGRRIALSMRSLGFVPIKSRRLMPGGYRDTVTRGWARPVRHISRPDEKSPAFRPQIIGVSP
jgi:hypothetical protein